MVLCDSKFRRRVDRGVFPGHQGGPLMHVIAGKAVMLKEAATSEFRAYAEQTVDNARAVAETLSDAGIRPISGGTDTHLILLDVTTIELDGQRAADSLERAGIVVNKNAIPFDELPPMTGGGIRFGTPAITSRGFGTTEARRTGELIVEVLRAPDDEAVAKRVKAEVKELCDAFPAPGIPPA
ncbi:MAG: serine hydroxymethyltransferase, partial [Dehalococcoidia bacterium]